MFSGFFSDFSYFNSVVSICLSSFNYFYSYFFLDKKVGKKSRKFNASAHKSHHTLAKFSGQRTSSLSAGIRRVVIRIKGSIKNRLSHTERSRSITGVIFYILVCVKFVSRLLASSIFQFPKNN